MLPKQQERAEDVAVAATAATPSASSSATTNTERTASDFPDEEEGEPIPAQLVANFRQLNGSGKWWTLVPTSFMLLMAFCVGFALLSLVGIAMVAILSRDQESEESDTATSTSTTGTSSSILLCIGVVSSVVGSLQTASGYCAQRLGHQLDALTQRYQPHTTTGSHHHAKPRRRRHPLFFIGLLLLVCGTIAAVVNLGILGQSVTAPFAAMTLIFNGCLAFAVLHEEVTKYDIIATVLVLLGVGIAMLGVGLAKLDAQAFVLADIEAIFVRTPFPAVYSIVVLGALLGFYVVVQKRHWQCKPAGLCCFSVGAGVLSGFSSLCVKCTVEVMKGVTQHQSHDLRNPILYVFVAGIPVCVLSQLKLMTLGLEHFGTFKFVPPYHAFIILSNLINGMVYFDEASGYDVQAACFFMVGCALTIGGVFVLLAKVPQDTEGNNHSPSNKDKEMTRNVSDNSTTSESEEDATLVSLVPLQVKTIVTTACKHQDKPQQKQQQLQHIGSVV